MLNVCALQVGDYCGRGSQYVNHLFAMVGRHISPNIAWRPVCFTDNPQGLNENIRVVPLPDVVHGWWNKLYLLSDPAPVEAADRMLYLDLDTLIVGNIDALATCRDDFAVLRDFWRPRGLGSGVMTWKPGAMRHIWQSYLTDECPDLPGGDQAYLEIDAHRRWGHNLPADLYLQTLFPGMFVSFKGDCAAGVPAGASVVCFHGQPKPHDCGVDWVAAEWNANRRNIAA